MSETEHLKATEFPDADASGSDKKKSKRKEKVKRPLWREILSWILTLLAAVAAALVIRSVIFEPVKVDGESMLDTLQNGEIMLVSKYDYSSTWRCLPSRRPGLRWAIRTSWTW